MKIGDKVIFKKSARTKKWFWGTVGVIHSVEDASELSKSITGNDYLITVFVNGKMILADESQVEVIK